MIEETAKYRVTGLIEHKDASGNVDVTFPVGSVQEFPVGVGEAYIEAGVAELVTDEATEEAPAEAAPTAEETAEAITAPVDEDGSAEEDADEAGAEDEAPVEEEALG